MGSLEDTFGEDFVKNYQQKIAERREQRNSVRDKDKLEIANLAVNEGKLQGDEPHFTYTTEDGIVHDVLLMQLPNPDSKHIFTYTNDLDSGAVTCPLSYLGEWMSCLFNDPDELKAMEPGENYVLIGNMDTWTNDKGEENDQLSPVRGVMTLDETKKLADQYLGDSSINEPEQEEPDEDMPEFAGGDSDEEEESDDSDDGEGLFGDMDGDDGEDEEDDSSYTVDTIRDNVDALGSEEPAVWEVEEGDPRLDKLAEVVATRDDQFDASDDNDVETVKQEVLLYIREQNEEGEDEEEEDDDEDALFG